MKGWLKLDNAAKIFPSVTNAKRHNIYRISFEMMEIVDKDLLQEALDSVIKRFRYFNVKLKRGVFWYYFDENKLKPEVYEEKPFILEPYNPMDTNGFLFRVLYYQKRISLEVFHALTDGFGATQFLKALVYTYLILRGYEIDSEGTVLTDIEYLHAEANDSFQDFYRKDVDQNRKEVKACHLKGEEYQDDWLSIIEATIQEEDMKKALVKYDCSVTQFLTAVCMKVAYFLRRSFDNIKRPFQVFIPVDLRRFFNSKSIRNFSICIRSKVFLDKKLSIGELVEIVKKDFDEELEKKNLLSIIASNVKWEKMFIMRIIPLFIKEFALKIGYENGGSAPNSFCISNLGNIEVPKGMIKHVEKITFANGSSIQAPINLGVTKYNGSYHLTFSSTLVKRDGQRDFLRLLAEEGMKIVLETNELEV